MMLHLYLVLNQLIMKLDRHLRKSTNTNNGFQAVVRIDGPILQDYLPKIYVWWAIRQDIPEPQPMLHEPSSPPAAQGTYDAHESKPDSDSDLEGSLVRVLSSESFMCL